MDRLDAMSLFVAVAEGTSLSAAGRRLGVPLATVSRKIADLEAHLRTRLLIRSTRRLELTDAGRSYLADCKRILGQVADAERLAGGEFVAPIGELVVTAPLLFGRLHLLPVVNEFLLAYRDVDVRVVLGDRISHLLDEHLDVAVRIGSLPDSRLNAIGLGSIRRVTCASPEYMKARGVPLVPDDLREHDCVAMNATGSSQSWTFDGVEVPIRARLVVNTAEAAVDAARAGIGLTQVRLYQIEAARRANELTVVLKSFEPPPSPLSLVFDGQQRIPLKLRAFLDFAAPRLRARAKAAG